MPLPPSALTDKDADDLRFGLALGVDLVALSFVQTADDVARAREIIDRAGAIDAADREDRASGRACRTCATSWR